MKIIMPLFPVVMGFPGSSVSKESASVQETRVPSLGWEDPLEKEMVTYCNILAWKNSTDRGAWWATVHGVSKTRARPSDSFFPYSDGS